MKGSSHVEVIVGHEPTLDDFFHSEVVAISTSSSGADVIVSNRHLDDVGGQVYTRDIYGRD